MNPASKALICGRPQFASPELVALAATGAVQEAWSRAFADKGSAAPADVTGGFAVGLILPDGRSFCAVDRFAIHSLCYRIVGGQLRFAARADELAQAAADIGAQLDPQALFDYLYFHVIPSPRTVFKDVQRLPPGHCLSFENGRLTVAPYWTPKFKPQPARSANFDALKAEFRALMQKAVARQLDGGKAACFLSGGTDSSTVAGMVGLAAGKPAATYSIGDRKSVV